jgi:hypothetical protein
MKRTLIIGMTEEEAKQASEELGMQVDPFEIVIEEE